MKIAILSFYSGYWERGAETWAHQLANYLSRGNEIWIVQGGPVDKSKDLKNYKVFSTNTAVNWKISELQGTFLRRIFLDYRSLKIAFFTIKILKFLWRQKFDIVIPTNGGWQSAFMRIFTWFNHKKMVVVGHSGIGWDDRNNLWCFPDCFVALSTHAKNWAKKVNPIVRVEYIPNGVDLGKFTPQGRRIDLGLTRPIVLSVGALEAGKRIDLVIRAVAKLKDFSLCVVGDGVLRKELEKLGKELLGERFKIIKVGFEKMPLVYRSCDVFVSATAPYYSFEMVLLEALASGLPVVVNDDPIRKEIVGNAGILVDPTDIDSYAQAIQRALNIDWEGKPRKQAEKFSWEKVAEKYEKIFKELIGECDN
jgi:glycosyltransferase involved in cell wall biosynthesis